MDPPELIYLNNAASTYPKPPEVLREVAECLGRPLNEPGRTTGTGGSLNYPSAARTALANLFHTDKPDHFIFTQNATDSLNLLIHGFVKKEGRPFHTVTTELEHNAVLRPLYSLADEGAISLSIVPFRNSTVSLAAVKKAVLPETRLVTMIHGSNVLGSLQNIKAIAEYCTANDIFLVVDAAQTAGHLPVDLTEIPVDAFAFTGHKALFGITGIGGFYIRDPDRVAPVKQGGTGTDSTMHRQPSALPMKFEPGTPNFPGIASLYAGVRFIERIGLDTIVDHTSDLTRRFIRELGTDRNISIYNTKPDLPVIPFNIGGIDNEEAGYILAKAYKIITRTGLQCAPLVHERIDGGTGCIRVSFSYLNSREECMTAVGAIREVSENAGS